jgi:hypothetical protein
MAAVTFDIQFPTGKSTAGRRCIILSVNTNSSFKAERRLGSLARFDKLATRLRYRFTRTSMAATYEKFISGGSGFYAGSDTQVARFGLTRPLARTWESYLDIGYSHNVRIQSQTTSSSSVSAGLACQFSPMTPRPVLTRSPAANAIRM